MVEMSWIDVQPVVATDVQALEPRWSQPGKIHLLQFVVREIKNLNKFNSVTKINLDEIKNLTFSEYI
jgi:hypothetical protein